MFDKLIGNNPNKEVFQRLIKTDRVPHSLLFVGKNGVGRKQFALGIAKSFVCLTPNDSIACNNCKNCVRASKFDFPKPDDKDTHKQVIFSEHPDIGMVIPYKKNILVDTIRELEKEANFLPFEAKARFFIIDAAEKMNDAAANALLKTLEEPAETTYIFLISSRPSSLLPTILSRCQMVRFAPIPFKEVEDYLLSTEKYPSEDAKLIAKLSRGSIGNALEINLEKYREQRNKLLDVIDNLSLNRGFSNILKTAEELCDPKNKDDYENNLVILQVLIHDVWSLQNKQNPQIINFDIEPSLKKMSQTIETQKLTKWLDEIETLRENLKSNLNRKIATDALFMQMAR